MIPQWLYSASEHPFEQVMEVGVAIRPLGNGRYHAGILYLKKNKPFLLHFAFHGKLINSTPDTSYFWVQTKLPFLRLKNLSARCRHIWAKNNAEGLPYAIRFDKTTFERDGTFRLGNGEHGLTCATFVLAAFRAEGVELLKIDTWPNRADDSEFADYIISEFKKSGVPEEHIQAVSEERNSVRYRPEEVVGASSLPAFPVDFSDAIKTASQIIEAFAPPPSTEK